MKAQDYGEVISVSASDLAEDERCDKPTHIFNVSHNRHESTVIDGDYVIAPESFDETIELLLTVERKMHHWVSPRARMKRLLRVVRFWGPVGLIPGLPAVPEFGYVFPLITSVAGVAFGLFISVTSASYERSCLQLERFFALEREGKVLSINDEHRKALDELGITREQLFSLDSSRAYEFIELLDEFIRLSAKNEENVQALVGAQQRAEYSELPSVMRAISKVVEEGFERSNEVRGALIAFLEKRTDSQ